MVFGQLPVVVTYEQEQSELFVQVVEGGGSRLTRERLYGCIESDSFDG